MSTTPSKDPFEELKKELDKKFQETLKAIDDIRKKLEETIKTLGATK